MKKLLIVHGPNLNLLGERDQKHYGILTLSELNRNLKKFAKDHDVLLKIFQSNHEGAILDFIHAHRKWATGMVINPGALTHYSYALRDAIEAMPFDTVEVHLSNIKKRESFRRVSVISPVCLAQKYGKGLQSYFEGILELVY
jgi:3-dehydroquinate dehydratase-2